MIKFETVTQENRPVVTGKVHLDADGDLVLLVLINDREIPLLYIDRKTGHLNGFRLPQRSLAALHEAGFRTKDGRLCVKGLASVN